MHCRRLKTYDGSNREQILRACKPGETLLLLRDPSNKHDHNAIQVCKRGWFRHRQIGHLSEYQAEKIAPLMDCGIPVTATVEQITGGGGWFSARENFGMNIKISYPKQ